MVGPPVPAPPGTRLEAQPESTGFIFLFKMLRTSCQVNFPAPYGKDQPLRAGPGGIPCFTDVANSTVHGGLRGFLAVRAADSPGPARRERAVPGLCLFCRAVRAAPRCALIRAGGGRRGPAVSGRAGG